MQFINETLDIIDALEVTFTGGAALAVMIMGALMLFLVAYQFCSFLYRKAKARY